MKLDQLAAAPQIIILGYGTEGRSSEAFLRTRLPEQKFEILENITAPLPKPTDDTVYVISPGIDRQKICPNIPPEQQTSNTEIFFENLSPQQWNKTIGISGTKGKSTTTKFCADFLTQSGQRVKAGGNYGIPALDLFDQLDQLDFVVLELSSFQLHLLQISPRFALFLNLFVDHLERHGSMTDYLIAKKNLWYAQKKSADFLFVPDFLTTDLAANVRTNLIRSTSIPLEWIPAESILRAKHFRENLGTVFSFARALFPQVDEDQLIAVFKRSAENFESLPHRLEGFAEHRGRKFYDDSIATNPDTTIAAIQSFGENLGALVLGGRSEGGDFDKVFETLQTTAPQAMVWLPDSEVRADIEKVAAKLSWTHFVKGQDFATLLTQGLPAVLPGQAVVLSPGAKSFDTFANYQERGLAWKASVRSWITAIESK